MSFRNDYLGIVQAVYRYDEAGSPIHVVPCLKQDLQEFAESWFASLKDQDSLPRPRCESCCPRKVLDPSIQYGSESSSTGHVIVRFRG